MSTDSDLYERVAQLQRKVSDLYRRLGQAEPEDWELVSADVDPRVRTLVAEGKTIEAIKLHRELTGLDLAAAKGEIDRLAAGQDPAG